MEEEGKADKGDFSDKDIEEFGKLDDLLDDDKDKSIEEEAKEEVKP